MTKICVTGGAGYCGVPLVTALLAAGHHVTIVDNMMFGVAPILHLVGRSHLEIIRGDVRDTRLDCFSGKDVVFHLAGISGMPACEANPAGAQLVNIDGTRNVVHKLSDGQLLINASTTSFYGRSQLDCLETDTVIPLNLYGETKKIAEDMCMTHKHAISLRWATVFGVSPRMRHDLMVNDFVRRAVRERVIVLYDQDSTRSFIHIHDQVRGYMLALSDDSMEGGVFNMGSTKLNYSKRAIANLIKHETACEIIVAKTGDKDRRSFLVNYDKARSLGFECEMTITTGIRELIRLYNFDSEGAVI